MLATKTREEGSLTRTSENGGDAATAKERCSHETQEQTLSTAT